MLGELRSIRGQPKGADSTESERPDHRPEEYQAAQRWFHALGEDQVVAYRTRHVLGNLAGRHRLRRSRSDWDSTAVER
jgi:hypothetical protein